MNDAYSLEPWQVPGYLEARDGRLHMDGVDLVALAGAHGSPLLVFSEARLRRNARAIRAAFGPRAMVCYAAKACAHLAVLGALRDERLGVEVNSGGELAKARHAGFADDAIVFNGVAKTRDELAAAMTPAIKAINVDSLDELGRVVAVAESQRLTANVALRLVPGLAGGTSPGNETGAEAGKFGMPRAELGDAFGILTANGNRVRLRGIHIHVGSQIADARVYAEAAAFALARVREVEDRLGRIEHVNLGGGFPIDYVKEPRTDAAPFRPALDASAIAEAMRPVLAARPDLEIVVEPGRAIVGDAAVLLSSVVSVKQRAEVPWLMLDAGYNVVVESFSYKWYYHALTANRADDRAVGRFRLAGPLCDSGDAFHDVDGEGLLARLLAETPALAAHEERLRRTLVRLPSLRELPSATGPGDMIAFLDVGAYSLETMTANNGRPRPAVVMIGVDGRVSVMRRRENIADMIAEDATEPV